MSDQEIKINMQRSHWLNNALVELWNYILMQEIYNVYFDVDRFGTMAKIILVDILNTEGAISELSQSMSASYESDKHGNACLGLWRQNYHNISDSACNNISKNNCTEY